MGKYSYIGILLAALSNIVGLAGETSVKGLRDLSIHAQRLNPTYLRDKIIKQIQTELEINTGNLSREFLFKY